MWSSPHTIVDYVQCGGKESNGLVVFLFQGGDLPDIQFDSFFRSVAVELLNFCGYDLYCVHSLLSDRLVSPCPVG